MSETKEDLKTFRAPKVEVKITKSYSLSYTGTELGVFEEKGELCGMKQLDGLTGMVVINSPSTFKEIIDTMFDKNEVTFSAEILKASPSIIQTMQKSLEAAKEAEAEVENPSWTNPNSTDESNQD